jgi:hypothetical protein
MVKKDKIFELKIEEDDELSGVDAVSLVDEPAIEINWVAFNKTHEDFVIPDGEDMKFSSMIIAKGQSEQDLFDDGYEMVKEEFISSSPNSPSFEDTPERLIRYKYVLNPKAPGAPIKETTREFCKDLLQKNLVYRVEDLEAITNDLGSSAMVWRGSYNCRHLWQKIEYRRGDRITNKGSVTKGRIDGAESYDVMDLPQPDTRVPGKASFAVGVPHYTKDGKLYEGPTHKDASGRLMTGAVHTEDSEYLYHEGELAEIKIVCKECGHSWEMEDGGEKPYMCNKCGYDNKASFGYDNPLPAYVDEVSGDTISKSLVEPTMFESYNDYPEAAKNNACKVLRWRDEHGDEVQGMTQVGWTRANQLCKGENISEETIARMASFARHRENAEVADEFKSTPWKDKGYVAWLGWGGTTGVEWAQNKLESIRNNMSKQYFQIDSEEKRIVLGPAMVPDQKIFRKDAMGNPYYVFFSPETIRMIAEKYMKNQYTRNNDLMHDGKAVKDVYVIESWIKEDDQDKSVKYGYEDLPKGTWFVAMKIAKTPMGDKVWNQVKEGKLNGFSVSGFFEEVQAFSKEEMFLYKVAEILKKY